MNRLGIDNDVSKYAFELFHSFSRFEFALKQAGWLVSRVPGAKARAAWNDFVGEYQQNYSLSRAAHQLIVSDPKIQVTSAAGNPIFASAQFPMETSDLQKVVDLIHIVRNNMFHGGKNDHGGWADPRRIRDLVPLVLQILDDLSHVGGIEADHKGIY